MWMDADIKSTFMEIGLSDSSRVLHLSPGHFIPTASYSSQPWSEALMKKAQDVRVGDWIWASNNNSTEMGVNGHGKRDGCRYLPILYHYEKNDCQDHRILGHGL
jgi:hypothetical protein